MKTILYATDYTDHSLSALQYAYDLSTRIKAQLIILHVFDIPSFPGTTIISPLSKTVKRAYAEQNSIIKTYCAKHLGDDFEDNNVKTSVIKHMSVVDGILEKGKSLSTDMIIIGIKDENSTRGLLEGDIAKTLITKAPCPLLVIPDNSSAKQIKNLVYATDFEERDIFAIEKLAHLASPFDAEIHIVHISTKDTEEEENKMAWFKEMVEQNVDYPNLDFDNLISDSIYDKLNTYLKDKKADLVSLLEREDKGLFKKLFHRDLVKKVESHTSIPLLSFNS
ncbi:universal stress protein [uncultured Aquimarina sp.]|uniref:universal stress protein n=1 Tax=uncultured Aquimarina sp. TaxID=575652 RepID=UPI0026041637|nr:universal stress protein [uncultured Aquimarina sp.]